MTPLFPLKVYWPFYLVFTAFVLVLITLDLYVFHREPHAVSIREAAAWSVVWLVLALAFNYAFWRYGRGHLCFRRAPSPGGRGRQGSRPAGSAGLPDRVADGKVAPGG